MKFWLAALAAFTLAMYPSLASAFTYGADFSFHVSTYNGILHPGDEVTLNVVVENAAKVDVKSTSFENVTQIVPLLTTAKNVVIELDSISVIEVRSGSRILGDLPAGVPVTVSFDIIVADNAVEGEYEIPVEVKYDRVLLDTYGSVSYETGKTYQTDLEVKIQRKDYDFSIEVVRSGFVSGSIGEAIIRVTNTGSKTLYNSILTINATPPFRPEAGAMTAYLGDMQPGESKLAKFRLYVMSSAMLQSYPVEFTLIYQTSSGIQRVLVRSTGLEVKGSGDIEVHKIEEYITPSKTIRATIATSGGMSSSAKISGLTTIPSRGYVRVEIKNNGVNLRDAYAMLIFDTPLLRTENSPYIGELKHGESRNITFLVTSTAPEGSYVGYVILKYRTEYGEEVTTDRKYVGVSVRSPALIKVDRIDTENLAVGQTGELIVTLSGSSSGDKLVRNLKLFFITGDPSLIPLSSSAYLGELLKDTQVKFRLSVGDEIAGGYYVGYLVENFDLVEGNVVADIVSVEEIAIPVQSKLAQFKVVTVQSSLHPDEISEVIIKIKNAGSTPVYNAVVTLTVSAPLSIAGGSEIGTMLGKTQPGEYYVGTINPGQTVEAKFRVNVDKNAGEGSYPAEIKVRYYDESNYLHQSNSITISLQVTSSPPHILIAAVLIALMAVALAVKFAKQRRYAK
jgi:hypothetical protein